MVFFFFLVNMYQTVCLLYLEFQSSAHFFCQVVLTDLPIYIYMNDTLVPIGQIHSFHSHCMHNSKVPVTHQRIVTVS